MKVKLSDQIHSETVLIDNTDGSSGIQSQVLSLPDLAPGDAVVVKRIVFTLDPTSNVVTT